MIADKLSRHNQVIQTEWSLSQQVFNQLCSRWDQPQIDLFATRLNHKLPQFVSPVPDPDAWAMDALNLSWEKLDVYAFPPVSLITQVVSQDDGSGLSQNDSQSPRVAKHAMVLGPGDLVGSVSLQPSSSKGPGDATIQRSSSQEPQQSESARLAPRVSTIQKQGFSDEVAERIEAPQRSSTRAVYKSKWAIFVK